MPDNTPRARCTSEEALMKLGDGSKAPTLDYNLPQKTSFSVYGRIPKSIPRNWFKASTTKSPKGNWWDFIVKLDRKELMANLSDLVVTGRSPAPIIDNSHLLASASVSPLIQPGFGTIRSTTSASVLSPSVAPSGAVTEPLAVDTLSKLTDSPQLKVIADSVKKGLRPYVDKSFDGRPRVYFQPKPSKANPTITVIEEYVTSSFLGDYGAGKTLKTFSLLPGEKTTITLKTYADKESTRAQAENILDSFTENSANEFENTLQEESGQSDSRTVDTNFSQDLGVSVSAPIKAVELGVESQTSYERDTSTTRSSYANQVASSLEKHVNSTSAHREVEVNTSTTETERSGEETSTVRVLENINRSRVLNFVFRQLQQEYVTVTYLKDLKFVYTNGYPESTKVVDIPGLEDLLREVLKKEHVDKALAMILKEYCKVYNYKDKRFSFLEQVEEKYGDCPFAKQNEKIKFYRKPKGLTDTYEKISVPGVILNVARFILRTDSVIADALLGQGEALDCYNSVLQEEALITSRLENEKRQIALDILNAQSDEDKPDAYDKIYGAKCCDDDKDDEAESG